MRRSVGYFDTLGMSGAYLIAYFGSNSGIVYSRSLKITVAFSCVCEYFKFLRITVPPYARLCTIVHTKHIIYDALNMYKITSSTHFSHSAILWKQLLFVWTCERWLKLINLSLCWYGSVFLLRSIENPEYGNVDVISVPV